MNKQRREWLISYITSHTLYDEYTLIDLFKKEFSAQNFTSIEELKNNIDDFFDFLLNHMNLIKIPKNTPKDEEVYDVQKYINFSRINIINFFNRNNHKLQTDFAKIVSTIVENPESKHILEVGSGDFPASSFFFTKKFKRVTAMDSHFYLSVQALKNMKVLPLQEFFNKNTDISKYDIVVGRAPCSAIASIAEVCKSSSKPYFIELCDCELPLKYRSSTESLGWENYLPSIDPNIRFYSCYAFNLQNAPEKTIEKLKQFTKQKSKKKFIDIQFPKKEKKSKISEEFEDLFIFD